jgi:hypothetical protein
LEKKQFGVQAVPGQQFVVRPVFHIQKVAKGTQTRATRRTMAATANHGWVFHAIRKNAGIG